MYVHTDIFLKVFVHINEFLIVDIDTQGYFGMGLFQITYRRIGNATTTIEIASPALAYLCGVQGSEGVCQQCFRGSSCTKYEAAKNGWMMADTFLDWLQTLFHFYLGYQFSSC